MPATTVDRSARRWLSPRGVAAGLLWLVTAVSAAGVWVLVVVAEDGGVLAGQVEPFDLTGPVVGAVLASFGAVVVMRGDSPMYGWLMLAMGVSSTVIVLAGNYSLYAYGTGLPAATAAVWVQDLWMVQPLTALVLLPALFPDGKVASPAWQLPVRTATAAWVALIIVFTVTERPATNFFLTDSVPEPPVNPTGWLPVPMIAIDVAWLVLSFASIGIGVGSLVSRWRRAGTELRQRLKWVLYAFGMLLAIFSFDLVNQILVAGAGVDLGLRLPLNALAAAGVVGLAVALGLAVIRYRLYDIDLVINRTIVYGGLTVAGLMIYVAIVVGIGALLPIEDTFVALIATGVIAVAFAPLRERMQGWVNRLMFGQRREPYAVLSELGRLLARSGSPDATLQTLAETVAGSLKLRGAAIELEGDGDWRQWASFGDVDPERGATAIPLQHRGETVGRLVVGPRTPGEPLSPQDLALLEDIAHQAGALVRSVRLTTALQLSRERLVLAREEERRRIRRDLHDEVGPTLASQTLQLDAILERLADDPARAAELVSTLKDQNQQLVADIRRLVHELRPATLDELGVDGALAAYAWQLEHSGSLDIEVRTVPDPLPALPAAVEVAAYRIAREAITNTMRHASANRCVATLEATGDILTIAVWDDGMGMDATRRPGVGLTSMRERTEELGGNLRITPAKPTGTQVLATLPLVNGSLPGPSGLTAGAVAGTGGRHG